MTNGNVSKVFTREGLIVTLFRFGYWQDIAVSTRLP